jgi:hypothetical protein
MNFVEWVTFLQKMVVFLISFSYLCKQIVSYSDLFMKSKYLSPRMLTIDVKPRNNLLLIVSKVDDPADEPAMSRRRRDYSSWDDEEDEDF